MQLQRVLVVGAALLLSLRVYPATVLVLPFHNNSQYSDLDWVGASIAETVMNEFGASNEIVLDRATREEGMRRLSLRTGASFTKGTLIKLGQMLDTDYVCYGSYDATLPPGDSQLKNSSIQVSARFIDLRKMHDGPELSEAGKLTDLSRLEEHLAWASLNYLEPHAHFDIAQFMVRQKLTPVDAEESYIRGLLSSNKDKQQKWFMQAVTLHPQFAAPAFELGKLALSRKEYKQALQWFERIRAGDPKYSEARFDMGLSAYYSADYARSVEYFQEVVKTMPLNEVYNNLAAAENHLNRPVAIDDFRRALEGDQNDSAYLFNLSLALVRHNFFDEATKRLEQVIERDPDDGEAHDLLNEVERRDAILADAKALPHERLKDSFNETAFRELKAMLQAKGSE